MRSTPRGIRAVLRLVANHRLGAGTLDTSPVMGALLEKRLIARDGEVLVLTPAGQGALWESGPNSELELEFPPINTGVERSPGR